MLAGWLCCSLLVSALYWHVVRPELRLQPVVITHGSHTERQMALTFDDGPHPLWTPLLADTLERHGARGTFFFVAREAYLYPEITARLAAAGHQIGNHSLTHPAPNLTYLSAEQVAGEMLRAQRELQQLSGQDVRDFRPPGGGVNNRVLAVILNGDMRLAWWSANVGDWQSPPPEVTLQRLRVVRRPGQVVLLHARGNTVPALERFLAEERAPRYSYRTLAELK